jgi:cullin 3
LPAALQQGTATFTAFYLALNSGRKLTWLTNLGSVDVKVRWGNVNVLMSVPDVSSIFPQASFRDSKKELNVSLYQLCILMQFNDTATLTLDALRGACEIPEQEFKRHLLSLCTPKLQVAAEGKRNVRLWGIMTAQQAIAHSPREAAARCPGRR